MQPNPRPKTIAELESRLADIAGLRIGELASPLGIEVPENLRQKKGFVGQLLEVVLGADGGNHMQPDFSELGVELKTIPVNRAGAPLESTYVSVVPLTNRSLRAWPESIVHAKLKHVLWLPVEAERNIKVADRRIGSGFLWRPDQQTEHELASDYTELMTKIVCGEVDSITADQGQWLHVRPKAANASALTEAIGPECQIIKTLPRGFYLRSRFTRNILGQQFASQG